MLHRDLKADNCFVDSLMRVKVADFGTGHIVANMQDKDRQVIPEIMNASRKSTPSSRGSIATDTIDLRTMTRTVSSGAGSLLWMAPERLTGRVKKADARAGDVYRCVAKRMISIE